MVASNQLTCTATGTGQSNISEDSFGDADYGMTVVTAAGVTRLYVCATDLNNAYALFITSPSRFMELYEIDGGSFTLIAGDGSTVVGDGDKVGVRRDGSSIAIWHDPGSGWAEIDSATNETHSTGKIILRSNTTSMVLDDLFVREVDVAAQAITVSASGKPTMARKAAKALTASASGLASMVRETAKKLTVTASGIASMVKKVAKKLTISLSGLASIATDRIRPPRNDDPGTAGAGGVRGTPANAGEGAGRSTGGEAGAGGTRSTPGTAGAGNER